MENIQDLLTPGVTQELAHVYMERAIERARVDFKAFIQLVEPNYEISTFHSKMIDYLQSLAENTEPGGTPLNPFLMFNCPPRHGKTLMSSILFPAWYLGRNPTHQIMIVTYSQDYSDKHISEPIRDLISTNGMYRRIFPYTQLSRTTKAKDTWKTTAGGIVNAAGIASGIEGKGYNLLIIDDPMSHDQAMSKTEREACAAKWSGSIRPRALKNPKILFSMTRWHPDDLAGHVLRISEKNSDADRWRVIRFPAVLDKDSAQLLGKSEGEALWPERYPLEVILRIKAGMSLSVFESEYMQRPTSLEGAIIKSEWWIPQSEAEIKPIFTLQSLDCSYGNSKESDYSAIVTLSTFEDYNDGVVKVIVRDMYKQKLDFPSLKNACVDKYHEFKPDFIIVEPKASGLSLVQEIKRQGLPIGPYDVVKMGNKEVRAQLCAPLFESGRVCYIEDSKDAQELIRDCQAFPKLQHDDMVDALLQALLFLRQQQMLTTRTDSIVHEEEKKYRRPKSDKVHPYSIFSWKS
jgi:predicted phage terminase large subunit-like protein